MEKSITKLIPFNVPFFRRRPRSPEKLVKAFNKAFRKLNGTEREVEYAKNKIYKYLEEVKDIIFGKGGNPPDKNQIQEFADTLCKSDLISILIVELPLVNFESKKSIAIVYNYFLRLPQVVDYVSSKPDILLTLLNGYENPNISLNCGCMLQESCSIERLTKIILYSEGFYKLFGYVETSAFHVSSDALNTLKALLTSHKNVASTFLEENYDKVFTYYTQLLQSDNYVVRWQSLKLLSEILRDKSYINVMIKFTKVPENFMMILKLLKRKAQNVQFEAFNVFVTFLPNCETALDIKKLLMEYQDKLLKFLKDFQEDRPFDDEFHEEKRRVLKFLKELKNNP